MTGIPRRNGQVEKMIETIIPILTKLLNNSERWYKNVDRMQQYINNTNEGWHRSRSCSGFKCDWNGRNHKLKNQLIMLIEEEIIKDYNENCNNLRMIAKIKIQEENRRTYNKKCKQPTK